MQLLGPASVGTRVRVVVAGLGPIEGLHVSGNVGAVVVRLDSGEELEIPHTSCLAVGTTTDRHERRSS